MDKLENVQTIETKANTDNDYVVKIKIGDHFIDPKYFINSIGLYGENYHNKYSTWPLFDDTP